MTDNKTKTRIEEKIERVNELINECTRLKNEYEERIAEAKQAKANYDFLIRLVA